MPDTDLPELLQLARRAATEAPELLSDRPAELQVESKSTPTDAVTHMDKACERLLVEVLLEARPADGILGEEGAERPGTSGYRWVIDPIDGTVNYLYNAPGWSICVGLERDGEPVVGVVAVPTLGVTYFAARGHGAFRESDDGTITPIRVGDVDRPEMALVGTGFGYRSSRRAVQAKVVAELLPQIRDIRRAGSAAVDICGVAAGQLDASYEQGLNPWDFTAASVVAREAGALVEGFNGSRPNFEMTLVANQTLFPHLHDLLAELWKRYDS